MSRFIYKHFGDDCPKEIEKEYNRFRRYEKYLYERDLEHNIVSYDDKELTKIVDPTSTEEYQREREYENLWECRKALLPSALKWLRKNSSYEYELIREYFFSDSTNTDEKITLQVLAEKHGVSIMSIKRSLNRGERLLKAFIIKYEIPH